MAPMVMNDHKIPRMSIIVPTILFVLITESRAKPLDGKNKMVISKIIKYLFMSQSKSSEHFYRDYPRLISPDAKRSLF
jgi:hypothetical protein